MEYKGIKYHLESDFKTLNFELKRGWIEGRETIFNFLSTLVVWRLVFVFYGVQRTPRHCTLQYLSKYIKILSLLQLIGENTKRISTF